jgi:DNA-binding NtrC family response regulator
VRELQNCIERAVILADGDAIQPRHLNLTFKGEAAVDAVPPPDPWADFDLSGSLTDVARRAAAHAERLRIEAALRESGGDKARAAGLLQVTHKMLLTKLREHRLE